ncbi:hypothetical protein [Rariglobus hedericola]|uniref:Tetratricopeptide repeat protein n=1 Tax=Rariglobus hedericola TaxID=2597822 RepID=A0A556QS68_9BACT|nr:hypothetical protein [Rariglobus hedericola]TSJ79481.1 hypothetical protein FPL22_09395 [Rariglobus hedericola]
MIRLFQKKSAQLKEWWHFTTEMNRDLCKLFGGLLAAVVLAGVVWIFGKPFWQKWRQDQALAKVEEFAARNDYRSALLALRRATEIDPNDFRVWREAAAFLAKIGSPEAVVARQNLSRLAPDDISLRIALVTEALRFGDVSTAQSGVTALEQASRRDAAFHRLAAAVSLALGRSAEFEEHLVALTAVDPSDLASRFNLAALRLWNIDPEVSRQAYITLTALGNEPSVRVRASLERLKFAAATRDPARVDTEVASLVPLLNPALTGTLLKRDTPGEPPGWDALLQGLKTAAVTNPGDATLLIRWLDDLGLGQRALTWVDTLPAPIRTDSQFAAAEADLAARANDLPRLRARLAEHAWGQISEETINLSLAARVQQMRFGDQRARATWDDAIITTNETLAGLRMLARLGGIWRDGEGTERALQAIVDRYPREYWACDALRVRYAVRGDLEKLWQLYQAWAPRTPDNIPVQQTWIMLGTLLKKSSPRQLERATELYEKSRRPADTATTLAYVSALWSVNRIDDAAKVIATLPAFTRSEPRVQLWFAILAAEQNRDDDLNALLAALPRKTLLREEQQLLDSSLSARDRRKAAALRKAEAAKKSATPSPSAPAVPVTTATKPAAQP